MRHQLAHGIDEIRSEFLDSQIDGGEGAVVHEDEISRMGVGDRDLQRRIEVGEIQSDLKGLPARVLKEAADLFLVGGLPGDGGLADQTGFLCPGTEDSDFLREIGMASLKTASSFTAAA